MSSNDIILRPLQTEALKACQEAFGKTKRFILKAACGFGKTVLAAYFIKAASTQKGLRCLFVVDRILLAEQTSRIFNHYGIEHGIYQGDNPHFFPDRPVQIATIQTLKNRDPGRFDFVIIDEVHTFHNSHKKVLKQNKNAFKLGLSMTPYTKGLGNYFDFFIEPVPMQRMIDEGELVPYTIHTISIADLSKLIESNDYTEESLMDAFDHKSITENIIKNWREKADGKKTILFGCSVKHIKNVTEAFLAAGIPAVQINGYQPPARRDRNLYEFFEGEAQILSSVEMAVKGFDFPPVEAIILATSTNDHKKYEQAVGRGLRISPDTGKKEVQILDFGNHLWRLGWPDGSHFFELDQSKPLPPRIKCCKKCTFPVPPGQKLCPVCKFPVNARPCIKCDAPISIGKKECPECGFLNPDPELPEEDKPELKKEITLTTMKRIMPDDPRYKQFFLAGLNTYAANRNYKKNGKGRFSWALFTFRDRFGHFPGRELDTLLKAPIMPDVSLFIRHKHQEYWNRRKGYFG